MFFYEMSITNDKRFQYGDGIHKCSFCGKTQDEVKKLIAGKNVFICNECVKLCNDILHQQVSSDLKESDDINLLTPQDTKAHLDKHVIGQDVAKKVLSLRCTTIISGF